MLYIRQVRVASPGTSNQHITHVRYSNSPTGPLTAVARDVVASVIDTGHDFRTHNDLTGAEARVVTRDAGGGRRYIATEADGKETNNLLELPRYV